MISKEKKQEIINSLTDKLSRQKTVVFFDYNGLRVERIQELRSKLREKDADCQVAKKTLIDLALKKAGFKDVAVRDLSGQVALAFGYKDEILPAKILYNFSKDNESLKILSGLVNGEYMDSAGIISLAQLPSREELFAKLVGNISSPLFGLINVLQGNMRKLIFVLKNMELES